MKDIAWCIIGLLGLGSMVSGFFIKLDFLTGYGTGLVTLTLLTLIDKVEK